MSLKRGVAESAEPRGKTEELDNAADEHAYLNRLTRAVVVLAIESHRDYRCLPHLLSASSATPRLKLPPLL